MKPNAVKKATALLAASLALATPALAGDRAQFDPIGFSTDGRYFAFEEFGIQDGSGFPYSNIYVLDLPGDKWAGTPVRIRNDNDGARLSDVRAEAASKAARMLKENDITFPAMFLALNADGEPDAAAYSLRYGQPGYGLGPTQDEHLLEIETFDLPSAADCAIIDNETKGFALKVDGTELQRDSGKVPKSRSCPMDYRVYAVLAPADIDANPAPDVAIISVFPYGFEGPDRRFIAVPIDR